MSQFGSHVAQAIEGFLESCQGSVERRNQLSQFFWEMLPMEAAVQVGGVNMRCLRGDQVQGTQALLCHPSAQQRCQQSRQGDGDPQGAAESRHQSLFVAAVHGQLQRAFRNCTNQNGECLAVGGPYFDWVSGLRRP